MSVLHRNNVRITGSGDRPVIFAHGFGCDQNMWRLVHPAFEPRFKVVLFDHVGAGRSDLTAYRSDKYASLSGYAEDLIEIARELELRDVIFVGHSVSAMIGVLASIRAPDVFESMVLVGPSPCYINDGDYVGGFTETEIEELLDSLADNYMGWSAAMAPAIMGNPDRPELAEELTNSFCRTDPDIAKEFARVTFTSDNRADLPKVGARSLILQCRDDVIASEQVGRYVHDRLPQSQMTILNATGHCPNLSAPKEVISAIDGFV
ncbi:alpha/beta fold hydrolase [Mesorhizobium caraganae]|uniref:alpha/beta fold hydrolase n=1 Tax=Mesorhizobium caraganae TaxID=483206 RepID=UPI001FEF2A8D|nr:alpha/beta hydrolase [Mesorhizobium caraganae]